MKADMRSLTILVDMDDTIADLLGAWVEMLNRRYGTQVSPEDISSWDIAKSFPSLTREQVFDVIITANKQMIKGDVLIDDGVHNHIGGGYEKLLMDAPHNRGIDAEGNGMVRVKNWAEIYREIRRIAAQ